MNTSNELNKKRGSGKALAGLLLIIVGGILMLDRLGFFFPSWIFTWPMILIIIGLVSGAKHQFKKPGAFILIIIGLIFLTGKLIPQFDAGRFVWPVFIIGIGLMMIFRRNKRNPWNEEHWKNKNFNWDKRQNDEPLANNPESANQTHFDSDYIDSVSILGGVKKNVVSKNFKGGDIVNFMGGSEINLSQADIQGTVILDITQIFGGTKIIVPPHWGIHSEIAAILGGIEDKRPTNTANLSPGKILIIKGTSVFGGIDIRSY